MCCHAGSEKGEFFKWYNTVVTAINYIECGLEHEWECDSLNICHRSQYTTDLIRSAMVNTAIDN